MACRKIKALFQKYWRRQWHPTPVLLPGESHGQRSLVGYSPRGRKELDTTKPLHFTSLPEIFRRYSQRGWELDMEEKGEK